jgi:hypothetical protein
MLGELLNASQNPGDGGHRAISIGIGPNSALEKLIPEGKRL